MMSLAGRVAVCVGATSGIGRAVSVELARRGCSVISVGRNETAGALLLLELQKTNPDGQHAFHALDCSLLKNVASFATSGALPSKINYLVQSQGIASVNGFTPTEEGLDVKLATHFFGRMLFVEKLLPRLRKSVDRGEDAIALSVLSAGVHGAYTNTEDFELQQSYSIKNAADAAGFYTDLALEEMTLLDEFKDVSLQHNAPGMVGSTWGSQFPLYLRLPVRLLQALLATAPEKSAIRIVDGMLHDRRRQGGLHLFGPEGEDAPRNSAHSPELRQAVFANWRAVMKRVLSE